MKTFVLFLAIFFSFIHSYLSQNNSQTLNLFEEGKNLTTQNIMSNLVYQRDSSDHTYWSSASDSWQTSPQIKSFGYVYNSNNDIIEYSRKSFIAGSWLTNAKYFYTFDSNNNLTEVKNLTWNGTKWVNYYRYTYTYDAANRKTSYLYETGNDSLWQNSDKETYTYAGNNYSYFLHQTWNGSTWENVKNESFSYDAYNNLVSQLSQNFNAGWVNDKKQSYTYDVNNKRTAALLEQWNGSVWTNVEKRNFTNIPNQTVAIIEKWDTMTVAWVNDQKVTMNFDAAENLVHEIYQNWESDSWKNLLQNYYTWSGDENKAITNSKFQKWNTTAWVTLSKYDQIFNNEGFLKAEVRRTWDNAGAAVVSGDSTYHHGNTVTSLSSLDKKFQFGIYPNPSASELNIQSSVDYGSLRLIDGESRVVLSAAKSLQPVVVSDLLNGVYFLQLLDRSGNVIGTEKFVKN